MDGDAVSRGSDNGTVTWNISRGSDNGTVTWNTEWIADVSNRRGIMPTWVEHENWMQEDCARRYVEYNGNTWTATNPVVYSTTAGSTASIPWNWGTITAPAFCADISAEVPIDLAVDWTPDIDLRSNIDDCLKNLKICHEDANDTTTDVTQEEFDQILEAAV